MESWNINWFMDIKSWQIVLVGVFAQVVLIMMFPILILAGADLGMTLFYLFLTSALFILLLYFSRTRKFGALFGILIGISYTIGIFVFWEISFDFLILLVSIFGAGIYYFRESGISDFYATESHIVALFGILVQIFIVPYIEAATSENSSHGSTTISAILIYLSFFGLVPILLLYFKRTRKIGAYLSILFGGLPILLILYIFIYSILGVEKGINSVSGLLSMTIVGLGYSVGFIMFILAGILYFWREKQKTFPSAYKKV